MTKQYIISILLLYSITANSQNTRIKEYNQIGWYNVFGTFALNKQFSIHTEYQWRRADWGANWQQSLMRIGLNYEANPNLQLRIGYGWIETFPYGTYPINAQGKDFTEHRLFQVATINNKMGIAGLSHRFMLEQRWLGRYSAPHLTKEDEFVFVNRMRYQFRVQLPLKGKTIGKHTPYAALYDEVFLGFGKNVNENVFDQNRLGLLLGYKFNDNFRIEAGYLNQTVQLGREINGQNVFQHNNGLIVNAFINANLGKKTSR